MNQTEATPAKQKARKELSPLRKLTAELDAKLVEMETKKARIAKLEKELALAKSAVESIKTKINSHKV